MTRMEDTARTVVQRDVIDEEIRQHEVLAQDKTMEKKVAPINAHFNGPFTMKHPSTNRNKTNAPT